MRAGLDLNLLRLLVALDQTRHLGRAAETMQMSQSGFSTALGRLRKQLGDELFVRSFGGMRPTPRAVALVETARAVLQQVDQDVLGSGSFEPRTTEASFRISMSDVAEVVFVPRLIKHLAQHAPTASIQIVPPAVAALHERLASGEMDLAIGYFPALEKDSYFRQALFTHTYACIVRRGHPVVKGGLNRAVYQALGHAVVANQTRSNALLDATIARHRIRRRIVLTTPNHLTLPATIAGTDLIATLPLGTAYDFTRAGELQVVPLPFRPPAFTIYQYWHRRTQKELGLQWLRGEIRNLFNEQTDPYVEQRRALYGSRSLRAESH